MIIGLTRRIKPKDLCGGTCRECRLLSKAASGSLKQQPRFAAQRILPVSTIESAIAAVRSGLCFGCLDIACSRSWYEGILLRCQSVQKNARSALEPGFAGSWREQHSRSCDGQSAGGQLRPGNLVSQSQNPASAPGSGR